MNIYEAAEKPDNGKLVYHNIEEEVRASDKLVYDSFKEEILSLQKSRTYTEDRAYFVQLNLLGNRIRRESRKHELALLEEFGYVLVEDGADTGSPRSVPSDLTYTSEVTQYNASSSSYRYTVDWSFPYQDGLWDTYDVAGVGMTNTTDYIFYTTFGKTFNSIGAESCYVDEYGNSSGYAPNAMTKSSETASDVAFNVADVLDFTDYFVSAHGRITVYIHKTAPASQTKTNRFVAAYEHNNKTLSWLAQAVIKGLSFSNAELQVTYKTVNNRWKRASGGKTITW